MSICEAYWTVCTRPATRLAVFDNVIGDPVTLRFCAEHGDLFREEDFRRSLLDGALDTIAVLQKTGLKVPIRELINTPEQLALEKHQKTCEPCRAVSNWIRAEQVAGRLRDPSDITRVGLYVIEHSCAEGVELNRKFGSAMRGE